nr:DUF1186 domain-containing protein [Polymorphum gilvum]
MPAADIISRLASNDGFPEDTIQHCLDHPDEAIPVLLDLLTANAAGKDLTEETKAALFYGAHILGEVQEKRAFAPLMTLLQSGDDDVADVFGDAVTETIGQILIAVYDGDLATLERGIANRYVEAFIRDAFFSAWTYTVLTGTTPEVHARAFLEAFPRAVAPEPDSFLWGSWIATIADLQYEDLKPLIEQTFRDGLISVDEFGLWPTEMSDYDYHLSEARKATDRKAWMRASRYWPFEDTIGTLLDWGADDEDVAADDDYLSSLDPAYLKAAEGDYPFLPGEPVHNPFKSVGRNDPCPCGSGKKYKKCCLQ